MTNRLILSAMITLSLAFTPSLAFSVPTQSVKKKSTSKTQNKVSNKSKSSKKATCSSRFKPPAVLPAGREQRSGAVFHGSQL